MYFYMLKDIIFIKFAVLFYINKNEKLELSIILFNYF